MEKRQIRQESELIRQVTGDIAVVEIDPGHHQNRRIVQRVGAEHSRVVTDPGPDPVRSEITGIAENRLLPGLQSNVGSSEPRIRETQLLHILVLCQHPQIELAALSFLQQLPTDDRSFPGAPFACKRTRKEKRKRKQEEQCPAPEEARQHCERRKAGNLCGLHRCRPLPCIGVVGCPLSPHTPSRLLQ
eukprot:TRINITY_DN5678_c0_g1_i1.p3 TRINITY_DN5678_c0_g1~~TRINITY_DN5678_c0_g1_i1.p3  ORF type:complete len:188 (-),score=6.52 TRINITY_DN5678_c0_g1_i1:1009-1572(-)